MRISILADCHINKNTYSSVKDKVVNHLPFRTVDHQNAFKFTIDQSISLKSDLVVIIGDVFDDDKPSEELSAFFNSQIRRLRENKIPVIIMVGNHDFNKKSHSLLPLKELELSYAKVIDAPTILPFKDHLLLLFPYSLDIEQEVVSTKELFNSFVSEAKQTIATTSEYKDKKILFFGHFGVAGASMNQIIAKNSGLMDSNSAKRLSKKNYRNLKEEDIYVVDLDEIGAEYVFLGDYHRHQVLPTEKCKAMYTGSLERSDFSEIGQKKGFIVYDDSMEENAKLGRCKFIEYASCREFIEIRGTLTEIKDGIRMANKKYKDPVVKVVFVGDLNQYLQYSANLPKIKDEVIDKLNPIHVEFQQEIASDPQTEIEEAQVKLMENTASVKMDVNNIISEIICDIEVDKEEASVLIGMAKEIYSEVKEEK